MKSTFSSSAADMHMLINKAWNQVLICSIQNECIRVRRIYMISNL